MHRAGIAPDSDQLLLFRLADHVEPIDSLQQCGRLVGGAHDAHPLMLLAGHAKDVPQLHGDLLVADGADGLRPALDRRNELVDIHERRSGSTASGKLPSASARRRTASVAASRVGKPAATTCAPWATRQRMSPRCAGSSATGCTILITVPMPQRASRAMCLMP